MVVVECSVPDCRFTTDDVSEALAIALLSNHNLAHCNLAPTVADAAPAPTAPRSNQAAVPVDSEMSFKGVMVAGRENRVAVGTEQQILRENEALKVWLKEQQKIIEEKERELLKKDEELSELNLRLTGKIMRSHRIIEELKKVNAEMARRTGDRDMDVDMLPVSPESTPEGPGTTGNQEDVMPTENTGVRTPLETNSCKDSAVQKGMGRRKKFPEEHVHLPRIPIKREKKEDELSSQNWKVEFLGTEVAVQKPRKCDHVTRLLNAWRVNLGIDDVMLEIGPSRLTVGDLWTLLPPHVAAQCYLVTSSIRNFVGGWLVDKVVEAVLWKFTLQYDGLFCADSTLAEIVETGASASLLWSGKSFSNITRIFVPIMARRNHWTLLVLDKSKAARYYFDPLAGDFQRKIIPSQDSPLASLINKISGVTDTKTDWLSLSWPCIEPVHFKQKDDYNCGVLICLFARCLCEGSSVDANFDVATERARITSMIFGCCYDDILERNINVCKVCRDSDGEDAEMRKRCGSCKQLFHASCIKVDSKTLSGYFVCPC